MNRIPTIRFTASALALSQRSGALTRNPHFLAHSPGPPSFVGERSLPMFNLANQRNIFMDLYKEAYHRTTGALALLVLSIGTMLAQAPAFQLGSMYECPGAQNFKVFSCSGPKDTDTCEVQLYQNGQSSPRLKTTNAKVVEHVGKCHLQTPAEAQAQARVSNAAPQTAAREANGIKVGDSVQVLTGFGWSPAKVVAINGNSYKVLVAGIQVTKDYPAEVRRVGAPNAHDNANGQYRLGDYVQVNVQGQWIEGKIVVDMHPDYQVQLQGNRTAWASGQNIRPGRPAPASAAPQSGVPPKPGLVSCAGKIEGRYATTGNGGMGSFTITFRSGKATLIDMGSNEEVFECWTGNGKIYLHKPNQPNLDMPIDINNDGTLQTPIGEIKKKGN